MVVTGPGRAEVIATAHRRSDVVPRPAQTSGRLSAWAFFLLTYAWSWGFWGLAIASSRDYTAFPTVVWFVIGSIGPSLMGFVLTGRASGGAGVRSLVRGTFALGQIRARWWGVMPALAAVPNIAALLITAALNGSTPDFSKASELAATPLAVLSIAAFAIAAGLAEEAGWRGWALERLRVRRSVLAASAMIGAAWSLWHLPLFFIHGTFQHDLGFGSTAFWWFLAEKIPLAVLFTLIYEAAGGLVAAAVAFHAVGNTVGEVFPAAGAARWVSLAILVALAAAISSRWRRGESTEAVQEGRNR